MSLSHKTNSVTGGLACPQVSHRKIWLVKTLINTSICQAALSSYNLILHSSAPAWDSVKWSCKKRIFYFSLAVFKTISNVRRLLSARRWNAWYPHSPREQGPGSAPKLTSSPCQSDFISLHLQKPGCSPGLLSKGNFLLLDGIPRGVLFLSWKE